MLAGPVNKRLQRRLVVGHPASEDPLTPAIPLQLQGTFLALENPSPLVGSSSFVLAAARLRALQHNPSSTAT